MTDTDLAQAFIPCPFCGCAKVYAAPDEFGSGGQPVPPWTAICEGCAAEMTNENYDSLVSAWNRRAHESRAQPASVPDPDWLADLRHELLRSKMTHNFTLTRDELAYILGDPLLAPLPAQPASVADRYVELISERDRLRKELAWNTPVAWVLRSDDPDPQFDFSVGEECPESWLGKAAPLYDGQGMRPINWQKAVDGLVKAALVATGRIFKWRTEGKAPAYREWLEIEENLDAALVRIKNPMLAAATQPAKGDENATK